MSRRQQSPSAPVIISELGKIPPQAIDFEEAVLGALMLEQAAADAVIEFLKPEAFYRESHQRIYAAVKELYNDSKPIDILTVTNELRQRGEIEFVGGPYYITQLTNRVTSTANIEFHARIIMQKFVQRELIRVSSIIIKEAFEDTTDVLDLLDKAETMLFSIAESNIRPQAKDMAQLVKNVIRRIEEAKNSDSNISGIPSGFTSIDRYTAGWQPSDLVIMAARPGMGKTAFVLSMARNMAVEHRIPVAFFSLEMTAEQVVTRLISSECELPADKLKKGNLAEHEWQQLNHKVNRLVNAPLIIDDTPALGIFELRAKCRRLKHKENIQMVIIDYLQLMHGPGDGKGNREQEISTISRSLKSLAKELNVPVICLSQLNRSVETRGGDKKPQLSDLRESGAIEQDADMVLFIFRPEYYKLNEDQYGKPTKDLAEIIIAKHRNGPLGEIPLRFVSHFARFEEPMGDFSGPGNDFDPNTGFDVPNSVTYSSRMNDESFDPDKDTPF